MFSPFLKLVLEYPVLCSNGHNQGDFVMQQMLGLLVF